MLLAAGAPVPMYQGDITGQVARVRESTTPTLAEAEAADGQVGEVGRSAPIGDVVRADLVERRPWRGTSTL